MNKEPNLDWSQLHKLFSIVLHVDEVLGLLQGAFDVGFEFGDHGLIFWLVV